MNKLFENIYFGKPYLTRDKRKALVWYYHVGNDVIDQVALITDDANQILVDGSGKDLNEPYHRTTNDIVSEYEEEISEEDINKFAELSTIISEQIDREILRDLRKAYHWKLNWVYNEEDREAFAAGCHKILEVLNERNERNEWNI